MKKEPLVSIIIPTFNRAHLIGETLDSIMAQIYTNWECIIVDDGSTDNTKAIINKYVLKDSRFRYLERPNNRLKGANACRNIGFDNCKGEYVNWFDSDDLMMPNKLLLQVNQLESSNKAFSVCQTMMYDLQTNKNIGFRSKCLVSSDILNDYISYKIFWLTNAPLWKRKTLISIGVLFDETLQQSQDYDFHIRVLLCNTNYAVVNEPLVLFRRHSENMSTSNFDVISKLRSNLKVKRNILNKYGELLKKETLRHTYKEIIKLYKITLQKKKYKKSIIVLYYLIKTIKALKLSFFENARLIFSFLIAQITYVTFCKGERLLKFKI